MPLTLLLACNLSHALAPPRSGEIEAMQANGTLTQAIANAKELGNYMMHPSLVTKARAKLGIIDPPIQGNVGQFAPWSGISVLPMPSIGNRKILVLLIDFSDAAHTTNQTAASVESVYFGAGHLPNCPYESVANYYRRSSYNQLNLSGVVVNWYRAPQPRSYYEALGYNGKINLVNEALVAASLQRIDIAQFDTDGNGVIDALVVKWLGATSSWAGFWWPSVINLGSNLTFSGLKVGLVIWTTFGDMYGSPQLANAFEGTYIDIHEMGHVLGLPDYYDANRLVAPNGGLGGFDMMDSNFGDHNAVSKFMLGWIDPPVARVAGVFNLKLYPSATHPDAVIVAPDPLLGTDSGEFYLIQFRKWGIGNDPMLGFVNVNQLQDGLAIWHVDARRDPNYGYLTHNNSEGDHKFLKILESDGLERIEQGYNFSPTILFRNGQVLSGNSLPNNNTYSGQATNFTVDQISIGASAANFRLQIFGNRPVCFLDVNNDQKTNLTRNGLITYRHLKNISGLELIAGTGNSVNPTVEATKVGLRVGRATWDFTGSNQSKPEVDGLILLRLMLGFNDANLLQGITIPPAATLTTAASIRGNINSQCNTNY
jgi:M6 family metalloprotease-like protein